MDMPWWLMPQPSFDQTDNKLAEFEKLYSKIRVIDDGQAITYSLPYPKWQFLSYIGQTKNAILHGSFITNLEMVEPQQADDIRTFSTQRAIYATTDGIWAIFFGILDRRRYPMGLHNTCLQIRGSSGQYSIPYYFFSISQAALDQQPWCRQGAVYILSQTTFEQEPVLETMGLHISFPHWLSKVETKPIARLTVGAIDFPFLDQIRGHKDQQLLERARIDPNGFPWLDEINDEKTGERLIPSSDN